MKSILRWTLVAAALVVVSPWAWAGEPVEAFLEKLRQRKLFDAAEWYLEGLKTNPNIDAETRELIPYEQARVIIENSATIAATEERLKRLDAAKQLFGEFLKATPNHPNVGLARVELGNVLVQRGAAFSAKAEQEKKPDEKKKILATADAEFKAARKELEEAVKAFDAALKKFPTFVPATQPAVRKQKNNVRRDLIEATKSLGICIYTHSQAYDKASKERKQYLTEAAAVFHKLYADFRDKFAGLYGAMGEARCHQELGDLPRALGLYNELLSIEGGDENLRGLQLSALRLSLECWNDARQQKYDESIARGRAWLTKATGDEEDSSEGLAVIYLIAQATHLKIDAEKKTDPKVKDPKQKAGKISPEERDRMIAAIKRDLHKVMTRPNDYRKDAQKLFALYGKLNPEAAPTTFADAFEQGRAKFSLYQEFQEQSGDSAKPADERAKLEKDAEVAAKDAIKLFRLSLELKERDKSVDLKDVHTIRYYLTFMYYKLGRLHDSALQGEFLATHYPQFDASKHAGFIAMAAWVYIYNDAQAVGGKKLFETSNLERVATLLASKWNESPEADNAWLMLADIKIREQDYAAAAKYLDNIPEKSERRADANLKQGQAYWSKYLTESRKATPPPEAALKADLAEAEKRLKAGIEAKRKAAADAAAVTNALLVGELSLAQIEVNRGTDAGAKAAIATLNKKDGFVELFAKKNPEATRVPLPLEAHKVLLRAYVATRDIKQAKTVLDDLDKLFVGDAAAARATFYRVLGMEISNQLKTAPPAEQEKLEAAFHEFISTLTAKPEGLDDRTLIWAAEANLGIAEAAMKRGPSAKAKAQELCTNAADVYKLLLQRKGTAKAKADSDKAALPMGAPKEEVEKADAAIKAVDNEIIVFTIRLGRAQRGAGQHQASFDTLSALLQKNDNILDAQIEICDTFLDWGAAGDLAKFKFARMGVTAGRKQPIWGLSLLRKKLVGFVKPPPGVEEDDAARERRLDYRKKFFDADYKLTKSLLTNAEMTTNKKEKDGYLEAGQKLVTTLYNLYGDEIESEKELYADYDALLKDFQKAMNQNPTGLSALPKKTNEKEKEKEKSAQPVGTQATATSKR
jgi:hypothetical protein